jgi:hypothetical protein
MSQIDKKLNHRKYQKMANKSASGNPEENDKENEMDFEFINEEEIESVKRGRKAIVIPEMVQFMAKAKVGQIVKLANLALVEDFATAEDKKNAKATNSAIIRSQAKIAGWVKVRITWDIKNVPYAKKIA